MPCAPATLHASAPAAAASTATSQRRVVDESMKRLLTALLDRSDVGVAQIMTPFAVLFAKNIGEPPVHMLPRVRRSGARNHDLLAHQHDEVRTVRARVVE